VIRGTRGCFRWKVFLRRWLSDRWDLGSERDVETNRRTYLGPRSCSLGVQHFSRRAEGQQRMFPPATSPLGCCSDSFPEPASRSSILFVLAAPDLSHSLEYTTLFPLPTLGKKTKRVCSLLWPGHPTGCLVCRSCLYFPWRDVRGGSHSSSGISGQNSALLCFYFQARFQRPTPSSPPLLKRFAGSCGPSVSGGPGEIFVIICALRC